MHAESRLCLDQVEYESYHADLGAAAAEALHCPRCSRLVTDAHGVCGYCRENAYQCRSCRNINYERRDPFQVRAWTLHACKVCALVLLATSQASSG